MNDTTTTYSMASKFTGSIPKNYDDYLGPLLFEPYALEIVSRIDSSRIKNALELSCGTGRVTRHLRRVLPETTKLIASDLSPDMLSIAQQQSKTGVEWKIVDSQQIPLEDDSMELIVCSFGYMFVADQARAFAEAYRVLRPGGTLIFTTWDKLENNGASYVQRNVVKKYFGDTLPIPYKLPFSMYDAALIEAQMKSARFTKFKLEMIQKESFSATAKDAAFGLVEGGSLYGEIMKHHPEWLPQIKADVESELTSKYGAAPMIAPMRAILCQAWK